MILLISGLSANAQTKSLLNPENLHINWQFLTNNYNQADQTAARLTIKNNSKKQSLPVSGWTIYFNAVRDIVKKETGKGLEISRLKGDLFQIRPVPAFKGLAPGDSIAIDYISENWIFNYTEAPRGFYLVWDKAPAMPAAIPNVYFQFPSSAKPFSISPNDNTGAITPEQIYYQNKYITDLPEKDIPLVFPTPVSFTKMPGTLTISSGIKIIADNQFAAEARSLEKEISSFWKKDSKPAPASSAAVHLHYASKYKEEEYSLTINETGIHIFAAQPAGIFYGIQTLKCLFPLEAWKNSLTEMVLPFLQISDAPRFSYRGLLIDVARNFQSKEQLLKMLNWMAMYKLNKLHLHFSDDEAWRIEIPGLPELTQTGVRREHSRDYSASIQPTYGSGGPLNKMQSGYYTRNDYIEIVQYAKERHIEVIPEIESPGHARAAIIAMKVRFDRLVKEGKQEQASQFILHDINDSSSYNSVQNYSDNVMCIGLPSVYTFIETVADAFIKMHREAGSPLKKIHMGGDEVPAGVWEKSPVCRALLKKNTEYKNAGDLWRYYWKKINQVLTVRGLSVSGWEEVGMRPTLLDGNPKMMVNPEFSQSNFTTYVWNNVIGFGSEDLPYRLANGGYKVILCPVSNLYFDLAYQKDFYEPGYYWGGFLDVDKPFYFIPFDYYKNTKVDRNGNPVDPSIFIGKDRLTEYGKQNIMGIQGHLWSENITSSQLLEYQAFPKLLGLAERAWAADPEWATEKDKAKSELLYQKAWNEFANISGKRELTKLAWYQGGAQFRIPTVGATINNGEAVANIQLPGMQIRYTADGTEPGIKSPLYSVPVKEKGVITFRAFDDKGRGGRSIRIENK